MAEQDYNGLGMPAPTMKHQFLQAFFQRMFLKKFGSSAYSHLLTGVAVSDEPEIIPDLSFWRHLDMTDFTATAPLLTIELTHSAKNDKYSQDKILQSFSLLPSLQESFLYNFAQDTWVTFRRENGSVVQLSGKCYSRVLQCYMSSLVKMD